MHMYIYARLYNAKLYVPCGPPLPQLQALTGELEASLSPEMVSRQVSAKPYLSNLTDKHNAMASLFGEVSQEGAALTELFKPTNEIAGDGGKAGRISAQISNLDTHYRRVEQLWEGAWRRVGGEKPRPRQTSQSSKTSQSTSSRTSESSQTSKTGQPTSRTSQTARPSATSHTTRQVTGEKGVASRMTHLISPTAQKPQSDMASSEALRTVHPLKASPARRGSGNSAKRQSDMYGDLESEAYKVCV